MPWCEACQRYLTPTSMETDGTCPSCRGAVAAEGAAVAREADAEPATPAKIPWHFWLLLTAAVVYLGWRGLEGVLWLIDLI